MERRKLGNTGFEVAPLALGGNVFGWTADQRTSFRILDAFVEAGFNLVDTADSYSRWVPGHEGGESETIIGRWIRERKRHDDVVVATKVGSDMGQGDKCLRRDYILQAAENSLRRLNVEAIDLYQSPLGRPDDAVGRNPRRVRPLDRAGQSSCDRRVESFGGAADRGARRRPRKRVAAL